MRTASAAALFVCLSVGLSAGLSPPALAQGACAPGHGKLGVARTVVVDASEGPQFGAKYREGMLLKDGEVVLTFDDGPARPYTGPILEALAAQCTRATFFMIGRMAAADPGMVKEVARRGHTVATHTWSHGNLQALPPLEAQREIELGLSAVQLALGKPIAPFFRFPYLRHTPASLSYLRSRRLANFAIDIDSRDFATRDADAVRERVIKELAARRKGIVLLHDIHASTARAMPALLAELKERGFRVVHITPRVGAETVAEYDALLRQQAGRKRVAAPSHPLAKRSIAWPSAVLSSGDTGEGPAAQAPADEDWIAKLWRQ